MRRIRRRENGQALVEMAIVTPLLLLLVLGIVQFGILFNHYITLTDAVRAGARQAAVSRTMAEPTRTNVTFDRVRRSAAGLDANKLTISVQAYDPLTGTPTWAQGGDVTVSATYPFTIDLIGFVFHTGTLKSETTERVE